MGTHTAHVRVAGRRSSFGGGGNNAGVEDVEGPAVPYRIYGVYT